MWYACLYWPTSVALLAFSEAGIVPALREYVPATSPLARVAVQSLHVRLTWLYFLPVFVPPVLAAAHFVPWVVCWKWALVAGVSRLAFDPLLNRWANEPLLAVGFTAKSDRAIRALAGRLGVSPEACGLGLRVCLGVGGLVPLFIW